LKGKAMDTEKVAVFIPIVAIVMGIGVAITAIVTEYLKRKAIYELHHKERLAAIEKGVEIPPLPPELFTKDAKDMRKPRYLLGGLVWLLVGIGGLVALYFDARQREWALYALIPIGVGVAYLLYYAVEGRKEQTQGYENQRGALKP
jgi:hypothetical protein